MAFMVLVKDLRGWGGVDPDGWVCPYVGDHSSPHKDFFTQLFFLFLQWVLLYALKVWGCLQLFGSAISPGLHVHIFINSPLLLNSCDSEPQNENLGKVLADVII